MTYIIYNMEKQNSVNKVYITQLFKKCNHEYGFVCQKSTDPAHKKTLMDKAYVIIIYFSSHKTHKKQ